MRTYSHGAIGWLIYNKSEQKVKTQAAVGAMLPDLFLAIGYIFHFTPETYITDTLHNFFHHSFFHTITTETMHSFIFGIPALLLAAILYKKAVPFFVGLNSHIIIDFLTHQRGGYNHFFPLNVPQFVSPVSYTSTWFTILEHTLFVIFLIYMFWNYYSKKAPAKN